MDRHPISLEMSSFSSILNYYIYNLHATLHCHQKHTNNTLRIEIVSKAYYTIFPLFRETEKERMEKHTSVVVLLGVVAAML